MKSAFWAQIRRVLNQGQLSNREVPHGPTSARTPNKKKQPKEPKVMKRKTNFYLIVTKQYKKKIETRTAFLETLFTFPLQFSLVSRCSGASHLLHLSLFSSPTLLSPCTFCYICPVSFHKQIPSLCLYFFLFQRLHPQNPGTDCKSWIFLWGPGGASGQRKTAFSMWVWGSSLRTPCLTLCVSFIIVLFLIHHDCSDMHDNGPNLVIGGKRNYFSLHSSRVSGWGFAN